MHAQIRTHTHAYTHTCINTQQPDNILINSDGHLKLTDFGLSHMGLMDKSELSVLAGGGTYLCPVHDYLHSSAYLLAWGMHISLTHGHHGQIWAECSCWRRYVFLVCTCIYLHSSARCFSLGYACFSHMGLMDKSELGLLAGRGTANLIIIDVRYQLSTVFSTSLLLENRWNHDNGRQLLWEWQYLEMHEPFTSQMCGNVEMYYENGSTSFCYVHEYSYASA
jgi:serine/threonine protein kinase